MVKEPWLNCMAVHELDFCVKAHFGRRHPAREELRVLERSLLAILLAEFDGRRSRIGGDAKKIANRFFESAKKHYAKDDWSRALEYAIRCLSERFSTVKDRRLQRELRQL